MELDASKLQAEAEALVRLHSDSVINRRQLASWASWYAATCEYPEFDIYGPFAKGKVQGVAVCPAEWTKRAKQLRTLQSVQDSGADPCGMSLLDSQGVRAADLSLTQTPGTLRSVSDEQGIDIEGNKEMKADLVSCRVRSLPEATLTECIAPVKTYQKLDDHYISSNVYSGVRTRPFYKDYRHYSRYGFAGKGAKSAWAANPKQTTADYDPAEQLYTKPAGSRSYNETFVLDSARCDQRPMITKLQKQMMSEYMDHNVGRVGF